MKTCLPHLRIALVLALALSAALAHAANDPKTGQRVPRQIPYRGVLEQNGAPVASASLSMTFRLYDAAVGGTELWSEDQAGVAVQAGRFSVALGEVVPIPAAVFTQADLYLEVGVAGTALQGRQRLYSVPYAHYAAATSATPAGTVIAYLGVDVPAGWLRCDGRAVTAADYPALARALGQSGTFALPDLRGAFLRGIDPTGSVDADGPGRVPGQVQGWATGLPRAGLQAAPVGLNHWHYYADWYYSENGCNWGANNMLGSHSSDMDNARCEAERTSSGADLSHGHGVTGGDRETRPVNAAVHWIIRAVD